MDLKTILEQHSKKQYSNSKLNNIKYSNSTVVEVFANLSDVIPQDDYMPFYVSRFKKLGVNRFVELANKARQGCNTGDPKRLFFWMLKNNELVR